MDDRPARLAFLLRRDAGRRALPDFLAGLGQALGRDVAPANVLPPERGDEMWALVWPLVRAARTEGPPGFSRWASGAVGRLDAGLTAFGAALPEGGVLYLAPSALGVGPVRVEPGELAGRVRVLAEGRTEECTLVREDGQCGLRLDYHASDHEHGEPFPYELTVWGADWLALAARVVPFKSAAPVA